MPVRKCLKVQYHWPIQNPRPPQPYTSFNTPIQKCQSLSRNPAKKSVTQVAGLSSSDQCTSVPFEKQKTIMSPDLDIKEMYLCTEGFQASLHSSYLLSNKVYTGDAHLHIQTKHTKCKTWQPVLICSVFLSFDVKDKQDLLQLQRLFTLQRLPMVSLHHMMVSYSQKHYLLSGTVVLVVSTHCWHFL